MIAAHMFAAAQSTQITMAVGASQFYSISPIPNQVGLAFYAVGVSGKIEIAGGGASYAPASAGTSYVYINSNGSSLRLRANGTGFPICEQAQVWPPQGYLPGAPHLWLSAGFSCVLNILYYTNDALGNQ